VLTAASGACLSHPKSEVPFYKYIPGEDHERFDISQYFEECIKFIEDSLKETNVKMWLIQILVHCMAGISRSVTLVIAYLIKCRGMTYEAAYASVKARRKIVP
jgi:protein-tyrosine phosphatase